MEVFIPLKCIKIVIHPTPRLKEVNDCRSEFLRVGISKAWGVKMSVKISR